MQGLITTIKPGARTKATHGYPVTATTAGATWQAMSITACS
jgi:hypothetical protein